MARVKCVMMQRDETLLLEPWLRYYGYLFGFENLAVFDNGSVEPSVLATLDRFERAGVTIHRDFAGRENFEGKGFHCANIIRGWDFGADYDFAFPLDCDEFLVLMERDGLCCSRSAIHSALDALAGEQQALGIEFSMFNVPGQTATYRPQWYPKGFLARDTIHALDRGFHEPISRAGGRRETNFAFLHYHNKPFAMARRAAKRKLSFELDLSRPENWVDYDGPGNHLLPLLAMTESDYHRQFDDSVLLRYDGLEGLLRLLGPLAPDLFPSGTEAGGATLVRSANDRTMVPFDEATYYRLNPDVAAHGIEGLKHYFRHGYAEKRAVTAPGSPHGIVLAPTRALSRKKSPAARMKHRLAEQRPAPQVRDLLRQPAGDGCGDADD